MRLSKLQRYILLQSYRRPIKQILRLEFQDFYTDQKQKPKSKDQQNIVTRSIERLIDHELAVGYGRRTPHKWYIESVRLTTKGKQMARKLQGEQQQLPLASFKKKRNNKVK
ncbi:hypothetical protein ACFL04_01095 [Patescibacteria group bacterium]